jgi:hypothetical protein
MSSDQDWLYVKSRLWELLFHSRPSQISSWFTPHPVPTPVPS